MIVQTRYMKGKQVNRATIFDFVQAHKNDGDNIISNDRINASWCIEFLIDYLYQVISIFNEAIENVKAGVNNPVSDTGLEELYIKLIEPSSEFNGLIMNDLKIDSNDKQTLEAIKVDKLDDLTVTELITQKEIIERLIKNNRKQVIVDLFLQKACCGDDGFNGFLELNENPTSFIDFDHCFNRTVYELGRVGHKLKESKLDYSLPHADIDILIYYRNGNWSLKENIGSKKVVLHFNKFEVSHTVAFEEVDNLKKYHFTDKFLQEILDAAKEKFDAQYQATQNKECTSAMSKALRLKHEIDNADWESSDLSLVSLKKSHSFYNQKYASEKPSCYLELVPTQVVGKAKALSKIRKEHELNSFFDFKATNCRKIIIRLSEHSNDGNYDYDLSYEDFVSYFDLDQIRNKGLTHEQLHKLNNLINAGQNYYLYP